MTQEKSLGTIRKQQKPFIMSPTHICRNNKISSVAYKLWNVIESKPEGWEFFWYEILSHFLEGRNKVKKSLKELEKFGFAKKTRRKKGNLYRGMDIELFWDPSLPLTQENKGSARVTEIGSHEIGSTENGDSEIRSAENGNINKDLIQSDGISKKYSLSEMENFWKELKERENYSFEMDVKKFWQWCCDEEELKVGWKNIMKKWALKPENQIKKFTQATKETDSRKITKLRAKIKQIVIDASRNDKKIANDDYHLFEAQSIKEENGIFTITVSDAKALKYAEDLAKINVRVELEK